MRLYISNRQSVLRINKRLISRVVKATLRRTGHFKDEISLSIVDNTEIRRLNRRYLKRDAVTDVISFPLSGPTDPAGDNLLGEVVVSAQKAIQEARVRGLKPQSEFLLYIIHGILHLVGYDDVTPRGRREMEQVQQSILKRF